MSRIQQEIACNTNSQENHQLNEKNELLGTVWPGKSDLYHAFQATLIPYNPLVGVSIAAVIAKHPKVK